MKCQTSLRFGVYLTSILLLATGCNGLKPFPPSTPALTPTPIFTPTPTPPQDPLSTWLAQGLPEDTLIELRQRGGCLPPIACTGYVTIAADGTVTSTYHSGKARISQEELEQIVKKFADIDFFSLETRFCTTRVGYDLPSWTISIWIGGKGNAVDHDWNYSCDDHVYGALMELEDLILGFAQ